MKSFSDLLHNASQMRILDEKLYSVVLVCCLVCGVLPARGQGAPWEAAIAKVTVSASLNRIPATAFVVAVRNQTAFLVTSAHVVEGDKSPMIEFRADPYHPIKAVTLNIQSSDPERGLALLAVSNPPASVRATVPAARSKPVAGEAVTFAGFPNLVGGFIAPPATIAAVTGLDMLLSLQADVGFSGGPVLRGDGSVVGLVWGNTGSFGAAVVSDLIRLYLDANGVTWGPTTALTFQEYDPSLKSFQGLNGIGTHSEKNGAGSMNLSGPWYQSQNGLYPYVMLNKDSNRNLVLMHPAADKAVVVGAKVESRGTYKITGSFARANDSRNAGRGVRVMVMVNGAAKSPTWEKVISSDHDVSPDNVFAGSGAETFDITLKLEAGDSVQFAVFSAVSDIGYDATALRFVISETNGNSKIVLPEDFPI